MIVDSIVRVEVRDIRWSGARFLLAATTAVLLSLPSSAFAQTQTVCGPEVREEVVKVLASLDALSDADRTAAEREVLARYQYCAAPDASQVPQSFFVAARECGASVSNLGSIYYEEMSCAGYDPQRRQFVGPVRVKQTVGFGGTPLPGSREYVLHCVADAAGTLHPVGRDSVHLANAPPGNFPTWQFAVIVNGSENLQTIYPMNGQTRRVRSILSWGFKPTDCNFTPVWGNALNYRIRLDQ